MPGESESTDDSRMGRSGGESISRFQMSLVRVLLSFHFLIERGEWRDRKRS